MRNCWLRLRRHDRDGMPTWGTYNVYAKCRRCGRAGVVGVNHGGPM